MVFEILPLFVEIDSWIIFSGVTPKICHIFRFWKCKIFHKTYTLKWNISCLKPHTIKKNPRLNWLVIYVCSFNVLIEENTLIIWREYVITNLLQKKTIVMKFGIVDSQCLINLSILRRLFWNIKKLHSYRKGLSNLTKIK